MNIVETIGTAAVLEQLAEESAELAQAALKLARKLRGGNPTPKTEQECWTVSSIAKAWLPLSWSCSTAT